VAAARGAQRGGEPAHAGGAGSRGYQGGGGAGEQGHSGEGAGGRGRGRPHRYAGGGGGQGGDCGVECGRGGEPGAVGMPFFSAHPNGRGVALPRVCWVWC